jgi:hypothetical protein
MADLLKFHDYVRTNRLEKRFNKQIINTYPDNVKNLLVKYWKLKILNPKVSTFESFLSKIDYKNKSSDLQTYKLKIVMLDDVNFDVMPPVEVIVDLENGNYYSELLEILGVEDITTLGGASINGFTRKDLSKHDRYFSIKRKNSFKIPPKYKSTNDKYIQLFYKNFLTAFNDGLARYLMSTDPSSIQKALIKGTFDKNIYALFLNVLKAENTYEGIPNMNKTDNYFLEFCKNCMSKDSSVLYDNFKKYFLQIVIPKIKILFFDMKKKYNKFVLFQQNIRSNEGGEMELNEDTKRLFWDLMLKEAKIVESDIGIYAILAGEFETPSKEYFSEFIKKIDKLGNEFLENLEEKARNGSDELMVEEVTVDHIYKDMHTPYYYSSIAKHNMHNNDIHRNSMRSGLLLRPNPTARNLRNLVEAKIKKHKMKYIIEEAIDKLDKNKTMIVLLHSDKHIGKNGMLEVDVLSRGDSVSMNNGKITFKMPKGDSHEIDSHNNKWSHVSPNSHEDGIGMVSEYVKDYGKNNENKYVHFFI